MALIECAECNKQVSENAEACPNCGADVQEQFSIFYGKPLAFRIVWGGIFYVIAFVIVACVPLVLAWVVAWLVPEGELPLVERWSDWVQGIYYELFGTLRDKFWGGFW